MGVYLHIFIFIKKSVQLILPYILIFPKCTGEPNAVFCFKIFWTWRYINALNGQIIKQLIQNTI